VDGHGFVEAVGDRPLDDRAGRRPVLDQARHGQARVEHDGALAGVPLARVADRDRDPRRAVHRNRAKFHQSWSSSTISSARPRL
jgi:hypothetical protein